MKEFENLASLIEEIKQSEIYSKVKLKYFDDKKEREKKAWGLIVKYKGKITSEILEDIIDVIDKTNLGNRWFGLTFIGNNRKLLLNNPIQNINDWITTLLFSKLDTKTAIDSAEKYDIKGGGKGLRTIFFYLSNPNEFNIMNGTTRDGLRLIRLLGQLSGTNGERYVQFNEAANHFKKQFGIDSTEVDWFLSHIKSRVTNQNNRFYLSDEKQNKGKIAQMLDNKKINEAIENYKRYIQSPEYGEIYKWHTFKIFQDNWNIDAPDFKGMFEKSFQPENNNLWAGQHFLPRAVLVDLSSTFPEEVREMFKDLFNENQKLDIRIKLFIDKSNELVLEKYPDEEFNSYQNDRAIGIYLSLRFPEKYYLYKFGMYRDILSYFDLPKPKPGIINNLTEFYNFSNQLKLELEKDTDLIKKHHSRLDKDCFKDNDNTLLTQDFEYCTINKWGVKMKDEKIENKITTNKTDDLNVILYGPPGTGKTYNTVQFALKIIGKDQSNDVERIREFKKNLHDQIEFITFHQNFSYEDFVQGLKPDVTVSDQLSFKLHNGVFYEMCKRAKENYFKSQSRASEIRPTFETVFEDLIKPLAEKNEEVEIPMKTEGFSFYLTELRENSIAFRKKEGGTAHSLNLSRLKALYEDFINTNIIGLRSYYFPLVECLKARADELKKNFQPNEDLKNFVLVIDEINRANISRVFGELITLLESDKRIGQSMELEVKLPSGEYFSVPPNLYIIGTMNTADKSIALIDIALRRRFKFIRVYPDYDLPNLVEKQTLQKLNEKIIELKGIDFQIGHSYFLKNGNSFNFSETLNTRVIPLLNEYFMNDVDTVKKVLNYAGINFVEKNGLLEYNAGNPIDNDE